MAETRSLVPELFFFFLENRYLFGGRDSFGIADSIQTRVIIFYSIELFAVPF